MRKKILLCIWLCVFAACNNPTPLQPKNSPAIPSKANPEPTVTLTPLPGNGELARRHVLTLCKSTAHRVAGSQDEVKAAEFISSTLSLSDYIIYQQPFTFTIPDGGGDTILHSQNITSIKNGASQQTILVGAHYDSTGAGCGADDNASGVAVLLEVADQIKDVQTPYTIVFIAFGAEEVGMKGSRFYVSQMTPNQIASIIVMINLDSLAAGDIAYVYGDEGQAGVIRDWALVKAQESGLGLFTQPGENPQYPPGTTGDWSDHAPFKAAGIHYAYFEATNWTLGEKDGYQQTDTQYGESGEIWHTQFDTIKYLDATFPGRMEEHLNTFVTILYEILTEYP